MTQYAYFNSAVAAPSPVIGWFDTAEDSYPSLPAPNNLLEVMTTQWDARLSNPSGWAVSNGALVSYIPTPPVATLAQRAAAAAGAGLTITLTGSMTLAATLFPTDGATQAKLGAVAIVINTTGGFPDGSSTYPLKDASGAWHALSVAQYKVVAGAIASYVAALDLIADGNPLGVTTLPPSSATLTI